MTELQIWVAMYLGVGMYAVHNVNGITLGQKIFYTITWPIGMFAKFWD